MVQYKPKFWVTATLKSGNISKQAFETKAEAKKYYSRFMPGVINNISSYNPAAPDVIRSRMQSKRSAYGK